MNIRKNLIAGFAAVSALVAASAAQAEFVPFNGTNVNMGTVAAGQYGVITNSFMSIPFGPNYLGSSNAYGFLPANTYITFTYSFSGLAAGTVMGYGSYDYNQEGTNYSGNASAQSGGASNSEGYINGVGGATPLVLASANLTDSTGKVVIHNNSSGLAQFQSLFFGLLSTPGGITSLTYRVSAVPLPAALPMFGALVASAFGFSRMRKNRKALAAA